MYALNYAVGDTIRYQTFSGEIRAGIVTGKHADIKNGRPGFDMVDADENTFWGYDDQIVQVAGGIGRLKAIL